MPELPEVETFVRKLRTWVNPNIGTVRVLRSNGKYLPGAELEQLQGSRIQSIHRRGKFIVFDCFSGKLVCHNAMSGYWDTEDEPWTFDYVEGKRQASDKDVRVTIATALVKDDPALSTRVLRFHDARLFGSLRFYQNMSSEDIPSLRDLGPDALNFWKPEHLRISTINSKRTIKEILMDQAQVAGIGNIYAAEGLWRARVRPDRTGNSLSNDEVETIYESCVKVLERALFFELDYEKYLAVYRKLGCWKCHRVISCMKIKGRSTYFCEGCQK